jgi:ribosome-binding factor A
MGFSSSSSSFSRVDRVRKAIMREMGDLLRYGLKDPRLSDTVISVTDVEVSGDLRHAKVFVSILTDDHDHKIELMTLLMSYEAQLRKDIGQRVRLRYVPELKLKLDEALERGTRMTQLLNQLERDERLDQPPTTDDNDDDATG